MAPILTIFIGGNHEASNYLQELPYGGWVAPNIYYLGYAGCVKYKGVRIGGLSGIYKGFDFFKGHFEKPPYDSNSIRSVYHYRQLEFFRLQQLTQPIDIMMSHDWPTEVYNYGNAGQLIRFKPHFRDEIHDNKLGSPPCFELLKKLQPNYWFSGHLHCKFAAVIPHENKTDTDTNPSDGNGDADTVQKETKFLALDKCLPNRRFLQIIDFDEPKSECNRLEYDLEWLTILSTTKHLTHVKAVANYMPGPGTDASVRWDFRPTDDEKNSILNQLNGDLVIPNNFERTTPPYDPNRRPPMTHQPKPVQNPQTTDFCNRLNIDDPLTLVVLLSGGEMNRSEYRDTMNTSVSDTSLPLNDTGPDDLSTENNTLNSSTASSGGITNLTLLNQRLSLFDTLPAPKNTLDESVPGNPEEADIDLSDDDESNEIVDDDSSKKNESTPNLSHPMDAEVTPSIVAVEKRQNTDENPTDSTSPTVKKIKRRNAAIYADNDDE